MKTTESFFDRHGDSIQATKMDDGRISIDIFENGSCVLLEQEQVVEFLQQLINLCDPEYRI